jgi:hypothetical protein
MSEKPRMSAAEAHSAGAVVIHASPFESLPVSVEYGSPPQAVIDRWVLPFYRACFTRPAETEVPLRESFATIGEELVRQLLLPIWKDFVANKPNWDLAGSFRGFAIQMESIDQLLARLQRPDNVEAET